MEVHRTRPMHANPRRWLPALVLWAACAHAAPPTAAAAASELGPLRPFTAAERERIERVQPIVQRAAEAHALSVELINGVIWVESKFERRARGRRGPRGLMQIMPRTGRAIARKLHRRYRPASADFNIHAGAYYLASMIARFGGDVAWGLAAYNHGPGVVKGWRESGRSLSDSSRGYAARVARAGRAIAERL